MTYFTHVGKSVPRIDSLPKALGAAKFVDDMVLPYMLYGKILRSPYAHARIVNINVTKAKELSGVKALVTANDTLKRKFGLLPRVRDQHMLAVDKVRYFGEEVAAVAAISEDIAEEALGLIKVEYEELPAVFDPIEAQKEGAPQVHEYVKGNLSLSSGVHLGDVEDGFRQSDLVRQTTIRCTQISHCQMEPYGALASWEENKLHVWMPNQSPFTRRRALSNLLGLPLDKIRVHRCYVGGAFGGRSDVFPPEFIAGILSMKTGRPVKITYSRQESLANTRTNHGSAYSIKVGVKRDGTIMAVDIKALLEGGAYLSSGINAINSPRHVTESIYHAGSFRYEGQRLYTNKIPCSMYHIQTVPPHLGVDLLLDLLSEDLGMDPVEIRLKNAVSGGGTTLGASLITSCKLKECIKKAVELSMWKEKRGKLPPGWGIGMGLGHGSSGFPMGMRFGSSAFVKFNEDATATVISGIVDNGQGNENLMVQIAAEELGLSMDEVALVNGDSELCPQDPGSYSSTATSVSGHAVMLAAQDAKHQVLAIASNMMEAEVDLLDLKDHRVFFKDNPAKAIPLEDVIRLSFLKGSPPLGRGVFIPKPASPLGWADIMGGKLKGQANYNGTFNCSVAEIEVDIETGKIIWHNLTLVNDTGFAINPLLVEGQMENMAGLVIGHLLTEKHEWNNQGKLLTDSLQAYHIPTSLDMPSIINNIIDSYEPSGPYGAKASGAVLGVAAAIANAIYNATGVVVTELPISPQSVFKAIQERRKDR